MDNYLEQAFKINFLKIGNLANAGVLQIGTGAGSMQRVTKAGYTTVGETIIPLSAPAVPLQAPGREITKGM